MKVLAAKGLKCPKEGKTRERISDSGTPVEVPGTQYYRSLVRDGSLVLQPVSTVSSTPAVSAKEASPRGRNVRAGEKATAAPAVTVAVAASAPQTAAPTVAPAVVAPKTESAPVAPKDSAAVVSAPNKEVKPNVKQ